MLFDIIAKKCYFVKHLFNLMAKKGKKVFVGLSGGVDSSVTALLLKQAGHEVIGVHLRCFNVDGCGEKDANDARRVAEELKIPFYVFDYEEEYKKRVVEYMVAGYERGETPNPDVMCNREIKFGLFFEKAMILGADLVATGHYAQVKDGKLLAALDKNKDQSYFLWAIKKDQLEKIVFPIGKLLKSEVREIAKKACLLTADKKDSQGVCFLGQITLEDFLSDYLPKKKGRVINEKGEEVGEHLGAQFYTIGQRQGLDLKDKNKRLGVKGEVVTKAHYVSDKDVVKNEVMVVEGADNDLLFKKEMELRDLNWLSEVVMPLKVSARVRYRQPLFEADLFEKDGEMFLIAKEPQKFVALGQSVVFYNDKGLVIGGGVIHKTN